MQLEKVYEPGQFEPRWAEWWIEKGFFRPEAARDPSSPVFSLVIPPPNVTGSLHIGHMLEHTEIDVTIRWRRMLGDRTLWLPGTDHAGIATQMVVERNLRETENLTRHDLGREEFEKRVWQWKEQYGGTILAQMRRMGDSCDWSRNRFTLDEGLSRAVREAFVRLYEKGLIYRGDYMVNWCPSCHTALSDLEVIHEETQGNLWHIRYPVSGRPDQRCIKLLYVGRVVPYKGLIYCLKAVARLSAALRSRFELVVIGDRGEGGYERACKNFVGAMGLGSMVTFLGYRPKAEIVRFYDECDLFVFPSLAETSGNVVLADAVRWAFVPAPPRITTQPQDRTLPAGSVVVFSVIATGSPPLAYQWRFNGTNLAAATAASYTRGHLRLSDAGLYSVVVSNAAGATTSSNALLTVLPPPPPTLEAQPFLASQQLQLQLVGEPGCVYVLQRSSNLTVWTPWLTLTNITGLTARWDTLDSSRQFYRVVMP